MPPPHPSGMAMGRGRMEAPQMNVPRGPSGSSSSTVGWSCPHPFPILVYRQTKARPKLIPVSHMFKYTHKKTQTHPSSELHCQFQQHKFSHIPDALRQNRNAGRSVHGSAMIFSCIMRGTDQAWSMKTY